MDSIPASMVLKCLRCGHEWIRRTPAQPKACPHCKAPRWDVPVGTLTRGRPKTVGEKNREGATVGKKKVGKGTVQTKDKA